MHPPRIAPPAPLPVAGLPAVLAGMAATLPAAWLYAWSIAGTDIGCNLLCAIVFALVLGYIARRAIIHGKVGNPAWSARFGAAIGAAGWTFHWVVWTALTVHRVAPPDGQTVSRLVLLFLAHPGDLLAAVDGLAHRGTWRCFGLPVTDFARVAVWVAEAWLLLSLPRGLGRARAAKLPAVRAAPAPAPARDSPFPPELEQAIECLNGGRHEAAYAAALQCVTSEVPALRADAIRLCGHACARLRRWPEAARCWETLASEEPTVLNALQAASSAVMAGDVAHGTHWLARTRALNAVTHALSELEITTYFITALTGKDRMTEAMPYLDEVRAVYVGLGRTDPAFLVQQRCPTFQAFLDRSAPIVRANHDPENGRSWYMTMLPHLDENGRKALQAWLERRFPARPGHT